MEKLTFVALLLSAVAEAQLYQYGIQNPPHAVVDVFDVPQSRGSSHCYDSQGHPQQCIPSFVNAAFNREVDATNTCGIPPIQYCRQTGVTGARKECDICDARDPRKSHPSRFLTDHPARKDSNDTWWQSETMLQNVQYPNSVNLTLNLRKAFDITYVRLRFHSSIPESFAIYKQKCDTCPWTPLQFYSASCRMTYGVENRDVIRADNEQKALCTNEYSDISPLTGGNIPFSTLEGRPSGDNFDNSPVLQDWVTATGIRIALNRLNTFGDEVFGDPKVLKSYFYAISDFAVGGRCKCNGHASECVNSTGLNLEPRLVCRCEHNTTGPDCSECLPFYQDQPWEKATLENAQECKICNCNGLSNRCYFDEELFSRTGSGGHCLDCQRNTAGPHCERCKEEYFRNPDTNECTPCYCNQVGSTNLQCDDLGRCACKQGVGGDKCDRCQPNFYDFSNYGCRPCACDAAGSLNNNPSCEVNTGVCRCKENVEGQNCDRCKPGFFNLDLENEFGCMACFCFGHSSQCVSSKQFSTHLISSDFERSADGWQATDESGLVQVPIDWPSALMAQTTEQVSSVYFSAPAKFLGDQKFSYNQLLKFKLKVTNAGARATRNDIVLEGSGFTISAPIFAQGNKLPSTTFQIYAFRLHEHPNFQWTPRLQTGQFQQLLANLTALRIRATFSPGDMGHLDDPELESAKRGLPQSGLNGAPWVEECTCPLGYVGQFCESCAPGFRREPPNGGPFSRCVPCNCNGHSQTCDVNTGRCICQHNTVGKNCERCAGGFYGYALRGRSDDCQACPCPRGGQCMENPDAEVICTSCPDGYSGSRCGSCADGFFGDLRNCNVHQIAEGRCTCSPCECSANYDRNAVGNCDRITGECLKCIYNTAGFNCERCSQGYYGNAIDDRVPSNSKCKRCNCYRGGTVETNAVGELQCQQSTGQCPCLPHVIGRECEECETGYWNLDSGRGCELCGCDPTGSVNASCSILTGQCTCKEGVTGRTCNKCLPGYYGFSSSGCRACDCSPIGSISIQCNDQGQCPCRENVVGQRCDRCAENMFGLRESRSGTCKECPPCYGLIKQRVEEHRETMKRFKTLLAEGAQSAQITDDDFEGVLNEVTSTVNELLSNSQRISQDDGSFARYRDFLKDLDSVKDAVDNVFDVSRQLRRQKEIVITNMKEAKEIVGRIEDLLRRLQELINTEGQSALEEARSAQTEFGKQAKEMGIIRDEARILAEQHVDVVADIGGVAQEAVNTSKEALDMATEALTKGEDIAADLNRLTRNVGDFADDLRDLKTEANRVYDEAKNCKKNAKSIIDSLKTEVPKSSLKKVKEQSADAIKKAASLVKVADRLKQQHSDVIEQVYKTIADAEKLLDETRLQQQALDELLSRADVAHDIARKAKEKAEAILFEGQKTLKILKNFDNEVSESRDKATEAIGKTKEIEKLIRDAQTKTKEANEGLVTAGKDSESSLSDAKEALEIAREAGDEVGKNLDDIRQTGVEAEKLRAKAETLAAVVDDEDGRLRKLEDSAQSDVQKAVDAEAAGLATGESSRQAVVKAAELLRDLERILLDLENVSTANPKEVERLKRELEAGEKVLQDINLDKEQSRLEIGARQQEQWINDYVRTIDDLEKEVINVENIRSSLPDKCYNYISIEQGNVGGFT